MLVQILAALLMFCLCVLIQGFVTDSIMRRSGNWARRMAGLFRKSWRPAMMLTVMLALLVPHALAIGLWALFYKFVAGGGEPVPMETALYFSASSWSTTSFGDVTLGADWRLVAVLQSATALLLYGWSAAFMVEIVSRLYRGNTPAAPQQKGS
jgi:hypothetical protein